MSNNYRFLSIVDQIKKTPLYAHANDDERSTLDQACKSALTNNVLTGIDFRVSKYVTELFEILKHRHTAGQKRSALGYHSKAHQPPLRIAM